MLVHLPCEKSWCLVINDLVTDQRVHPDLYYSGISWYDCIVVGRRNRERLSLAEVNINASDDLPG